jgi:hypothetical protein
MVPDKMERIWCNDFRGHKPFGRFAIVGELEKMQHLGVFLFQDTGPRVIRDRIQLTTKCMVPQFPVSSGKYGICVWNWSHLELWIRGERLRGEYLVCYRFLLGIFFPFHIPGCLLIDSSSDQLCRERLPFPTFELSGKEFLRVTQCFDSFFIFPESFPLLWWDSNCITPCLIEEGQLSTC